MAKLKKVLNWFVSIEEDGDESASEEEAPEVEAPAAAAHQGHRVMDLGLDPYAGELDEEAIGSPMAGGAGLADFGEIYSLAHLPTEDDDSFTIFKAERLLHSEHIVELSQRAKAASVMVALEANGVRLQDVIQDAVARDKALDQYHSVASRDVQNLANDVEFKNQMLQEEIEQFLNAKQEEIRANKASLENAKMELEAWARRKAEEEERLFEVVSFFVAENPITRD